MIPDFKSRIIHILKPLKRINIMKENMTIIILLNKNMILHNRINTNKDMKNNIQNNHMNTQMNRRSIYNSNKIINSNNMSKIIIKVIRIKIKR